MSSVNYCVSIPYRKYKKYIRNRIVVTSDEVSIPYRKYKKNSDKYTHSCIYLVSIPYRKYKKLAMHSNNLL